MALCLMWAETEIIGVMQNLQNELNRECIKYHKYRYVTHCRKKLTKGLRWMMDEQWNLP